jgi:hypothetical protein
MLWTSSRLQNYQATWSSTGMMRCKFDNWALPKALCHPLLLVRRLGKLDDALCHILHPNDAC